MDHTSNTIYVGFKVKETDKDLEKIKKTKYKTRSIDLHGYTLDAAYEK